MAGKRNGAFTPKKGKEGDLEKKGDGGGGQLGTSPERFL